MRKHEDFEDYVTYLLTCICVVVLFYLTSIVMDIIY